MDYAALLYDPIYETFGVPATLTPNRDYAKLDFPFGLEGARGTPHPPPTSEEELPGHG